MQINRMKKFETISIMNLGEVDFTDGGKYINEIHFSSFFPSFYDGSYCKYANIPKPQDAMQQVTKWMDSKEPIRLIITETPINMLVNLAFHNSEYKGGEPGDIYFDLSCRTYRTVKVKSKQVTVKKVTTRPDTKPKPKNYTVKSGDSLWKIAAMKQHYGAGSRWPEIYNRNKSVVGKNPNLIYPGQKLVIP
ncbi:XkdP [Bacillus phage BalMu-1]|nr:XkdP [Bacillus phage BalMu-1]